ncbi:MAG TPA: hypothetical protein VKB93_28710 [Thermoanaerobaculia bacterium]|nr:hypothetical protein [Thermoanaerobaculia bacterium]
MRRAAFVSILLTAFLLAGCGNPKNLVVTAENQDEVLQKVARSKKLSDEEKQTFAAAVMRAGMARAFSEALGGKPSADAPVVIGKTVGQIIEEARERTAKEKERVARMKRLAEEVRRRQDARLKIMRDAVLVTPLSMKDLPGGFMAAIELKYAIENTSGKEIRAFEGTVRFRDVLGHRVEDGYVKVNEPLEPGEKRTITKSQFVTQLGGRKLSDVRAEWIPDTVLFADGTRLDRRERAPQ